MVLLALVLVAVKVGGSRTSEPGLDREDEVLRAGGKKLGVYLAAKHAGAKVLILSEPKLGVAATKPDQLIAGFKEGVGSALTIVGEVSPEIPADKAKAFSPGVPLEESAVPPG